MSHEARPEAGELPLKPGSPESVAFSKVERSPSRGSQRGKMCTMFGYVVDAHENKSINFGSGESPYHRRLRLREEAERKATERKNSASTETPSLNGSSAPGSPASSAPANPSPSAEEKRTAEEKLDVEEILEVTMDQQGMPVSEVIKVKKVHEVVASPWKDGVRVDVTV